MIHNKDSNTIDKEINIIYDFISDSSFIKFKE